MKVAAFVQLRRTLTPTGVGIHTIEMCRGLHAQPDIDLKLLVSGKELNGDGRISSRFPVNDLPACSYPLSRVWMERIWRVLRMPSADRWCPGSDWVYSPAETFVPVKKAKSVVTIHDMYPCERDLPWSDSPEHVAKRKRWESLMKCILPTADLLLAVSEFTKGRIVDMTGFDADRIVVTGNGVSEPYYNAGTGEIQSPVNGNYILVVGGLTKRKRGDSVLKVASELHQRGVETKIVVAGKCREYYAQQAAELPNVELLGYVDDDVLPALLANAKALLFLSQYEGFGMPAAEAMAAGTPVIASHHAALPEIVGDAGLVVNPDNASQAANEVENLLRDESAQQQLIAKGRERAKQFTWQACVDRLVSALKTHT